MKEKQPENRLKNKSVPTGNQEEYQVHTMANGIRIAYRHVGHTQIAHCGIMLDIGSRDELPGQEGLAHFWEHMAFKGTERRKSHHIINRLETVGGELNAYTTKEKVCFHASILDLHFERAIDVLSDITFHSVFPDKQLELERNVILEEMSMYYDSPEDAIQDDFDEMLFQKHSLGNNILGTADTVRSFSKEDLQAFINRNLDTSRIIVSFVGPTPFNKVVRLVEKYLSDIEEKHTERLRVCPSLYTPSVKTVSRPVTQAQCAMGRPSYALADHRRLPFFMLVNLLGGPGMNSRFNMALREKYGFVYTIDASYTPYLDTGFLGIYFGTEPQQLDRSIYLIHKELRKLRQQPLTALQLHHTKEQLMGQLAMSEESNAGYMLMMAKSLLDTGKVDSLPEIFDEIRNVTSSQLMELANEMFDEKEFSYLTFVPEKSTR